MKKAIYFFIAIVAVTIGFFLYRIQREPKVNTQIFSTQAADQNPSSFKELYKGKVVDIYDETQQQSNDISILSEQLSVQLLSGPDKGTQTMVDFEEQLNDIARQEILPGDTVVLGRLASPSGTSYVILDRYRLPSLALLAGIFLLLAIVFGRLRGITAVIGLLVGFTILVWFIAPNIIAGKNPVAVTFVGAAAVAMVSMFLAHGFNRRTSLAIISTLITLGIAVLLAQSFVVRAKLLGNGSEDAFYLQQGFFGHLNLQALLLSGIIIGTLGILNDITTAQSATVEEIHTANRELTFKQLYQKGSSVGKEHIASLINTLVLIYVGSSLPLFLLYSVNGTQLWTIINSSSIAEEIARTLVGSVALILAVPITTALSAYYYHYEKKKEEPVKDSFWKKALSRVL